MSLTYTLILYLCLPLVFARLLWRGLRNRDYLKRWPERLGFVPPPPVGRPVILLHAVSVGEVQASRPLVDYLHGTRPGATLVLTTTTPTGAALARRLFEDRVVHRYLPWDLPGAMGRFLSRVDPAVVIIMETEIWPNLFHLCRRRGIPLALVNARLSQKSWQGYRRLGGFTAGTLRCLSLIAAQSETDAERFISLGADPGRITVTGNLKFDIRQPASTVEAGLVLRRFFGPHRPVWIAASTHAGEERLVLEAFEQVLARFPDALLVLAPRHPERAGEVADLCRSRDFEFTRHTRKDQYSGETRVYILDTLGELPMFYAASDISFVGGSLVKVGGHNMLEPAALGVPVLSGPETFNFAAVTRLLGSAGALLQVESAGDLAARVCELLDDADRRHAMGEQGRDVVVGNQGSLTCLTEALAGLLPRREAY